MKKYKRVYCALTAAIFLAIGLLFALGRGSRPDISELSEAHPAVKMYREGVWTGRYEGCYVNDAAGDRSVRVSIDVQKEMSREDMVSILDYYELVWNARYVGSSYMGERENDFTGYAVFFLGETDEELGRVKYFNGKEAEIAEEDAPFFPQAYMRSDPGPHPWM